MTRDKTQFLRLPSDIIESPAFPPSVSASAPVPADCLS